MLEGMKRIGTCMAYGAGIGATAGAAFGTGAAPVVYIMAGLAKITLSYSINGQADAIRGASLGGTSFKRSAAVSIVGSTIFGAAVGGAAGAVFGVGREAAKKAWKWIK